MNIAIPILLTPPVYNGLSKYIINLINSLQEVDSAHKYYVILNKELDDLITIDHPNFKKVFVNIPHHPRVLMRPYYFFWQNFLSNRIWRKYNIDLVHLANPIPLFNTFGIPYIVTIHDVAEYSFKRHSSFRNHWRKISAKFSANKATSIITVSNFSKSEIQNYLNVPAEKIYVTYLGSDVYKNFRNINGHRSRRFLHIGGDRFNKNTNIILGAYKKLKQEHPEISLLFVGLFSKQFKERIKLGINSSVGISYKENVSLKSLSEYYRDSIALVYPSLYEGFGLPIVEAMSCGLPVITSDRTSMPEIGGNAVLKVDPTKVLDVYSSMKAILENEDISNSFQEKGIQRAKDFSWIKCAEETIKVYSGITIL